MTQKVAIIEDEPSLSEMFKFKLESEGYEVRTAPNSWEGVEMVEDFRPDLLLLDIMMPYESGDITLSKIRQTEFGKGLKVLFMTNTDMQEAPKAIRSMSFKRYVIKASMTPKQVAAMVKDELNDKTPVSA
jgi:DNA-binding response OmpR family regulator